MEFLKTWSAICEPKTAISLEHGDMRTPSLYPRPKLEKQFKDWDIRLVEGVSRLLSFMPTGWDAELLTGSHSLLGCELSGALLEKLFSYNDRGSSKAAAETRFDSGLKVGFAPVYDNHSDEGAVILYLETLLLLVLDIGISKG